MDGLDSKRFDGGLDVFFTKDFDAYAYVNSALSGVPATAQTVALENLRTDLKANGEKLKSQLIDLLNREYKDFIGLASNLVGTSESIETITQQLSEVRQRVQGVHDNVHKALTAVDSKLDERKQAKAKRACLDGLLEIHQSLRLVKSLLSMCKQLPASESSAAKAKLPAAAAVPEPAAPATSAADPAFALYEQMLNDAASLEPFDAKAAETKTGDASGEEAVLHNAVLMERLARQFGALKILCSRLHKFELVREQSDQIKRLEAEFEQRLSDAFLLAVQLKQTAAITQLLRAFAFCDRVSLAEQLVRERLVRPALQQLVTKERLRGVVPASAPAKSATGTTTLSPSEAVAQMFGGVLSFVPERWACLLEPSTAGHSSPFRFDFLGNAIWAEIAEALTQLGPTLFSNGIPEVFHSNYTQSLALVRALEALCDGPQQLAQLRAHPASVAFRGRFNCAVYYTLRFGAIVGQFEAALSKPPTFLQSEDGKAESKADSKAASSTWALTATQTLWECMNQCWSEGVFLEELTHRFFKLTLQLLARYLGWIEQGASITITATPAAAAASANANANANADDAPSSPPRGSSVTALVTAGGPWADLSADLLVSVLADLRALADAVPAKLLPAIVARIRAGDHVVAPPGSSAVPIEPAAIDAAALDKLLRSGLQETQERLQRGPRVLADKLGAELARRSCELLAIEVPNVKKKYRLMNQPAPTKPLDYCEKALAPLKQQLWATGSRARRLLPDSERTRLTVTVCAQAAERFVSLAEAILAEMQGMEATLMRLKNSARAAAAPGAPGAGAGGGSGGAANETIVGDLEKIRLQLLLDAKEFLRLVDADFALSPAAATRIEGGAGLVQIDSFVKALQNRDRSADF